jgi:hypothetical protein
VWSPRHISSDTTDTTAHAHMNTPLKLTNVLGRAEFWTIFQRTDGESSWCSLPKRMQLTFTACVESLNTRGAGRGKSYILSRWSWEIIQSVKTVVGNHTFWQDGRGKSYNVMTVVENHTFWQDGRGKSYTLSDGRGKSYVLSRARFSVTLWRIFLIPPAMC